MPCWRLPNYVDEDKSDDDDSDDSMEYSYVRGLKVILLQITYCCWFEVVE